MSRPIQFRRALKCDEEQVIKLLQDFAKEHGVWEGLDATTEEIDEKEVKTNYFSPTDKPIYHCFVATSHCKTMGFCFLFDSDPGDWIILEFYVVKRERGQTIGTQLAQHVIDFCRDQNVDMKEHRGIQASSHTSNRKARRFWEKVGFTTIKRNVTFLDRTIYGPGTFDVNRMELNWKK